MINISGGQIEKESKRGAGGDGTAVRTDGWIGGDIPETFVASVAASEECSKAGGELYKP